MAQFTNLDQLFEKMVEKATHITLDSELQTTILLDIDGDEPRRWFVRFEGRQVSVTAINGIEPQVTVFTDKDTILKVAQRQVNPTMAFLTGKIKVKGDPAVLGQLKIIWPD
ncbi:MAG: SCP2 sterol-binding domain-containing protein [Deltaproteobacteria bacterium]|jgi:putative sterol carrier protein|nr:SCP2 sterol-binding domain-containing protein [Deltaproteobacteria bacterium]